MLYSAFIANFTSFPAWAEAPVYRLIHWLQPKFFVGYDGESAMFVDEYIAVAFVAAVHLVVIAIITGLVYLGFRRWKRHRGQP